MKLSAKISYMFDKKDRYYLPIFLSEHKILNKKSKPGNTTRSLIFIIVCVILSAFSSLVNLTKEISNARDKTHDQDMNSPGQKRVIGQPVK